MNSHDNDHGDTCVDVDVDVDPEGGGHGDAAGDVPHPPLLGKLQVSNCPFYIHERKIISYFCGKLDSALCKHLYLMIRDVGRENLCLRAQVILIKTSKTENNLH